MKSVIYILSVLFLLPSCTNEPKIGQYVYVDFLNTIHINKECSSKKIFDNPRTEEERIANAKGITFIDTLELVSKYEREDGDLENYEYCQRCIDDAIYSSLSVIQKRNDEYYRRKKEIYDELVRDNYDMESFNEFLWRIKKRTRRMRLHGVMLKDGYAIDSTFEKFSEYLGFKD